MPLFAYTARDKSGNPCNGTVDAADRNAALVAIRAEGRYPITVRPAEEVAEETPSAIGVKISRAEVIQFSSQLAVMVETGVTLSDALDCIAKQAHRPNVKSLVADLSQQLQQGISFSEALSRHPRSFPTLYVALIKASEKTGMLSKLLLRATAYLRDEQDTLRKVKGALTYPCIMMAFACTTTIFLLAFVLPRFAVIYANKKAALPLPTQILLGASDFLLKNWIALLAGAATLGLLLYFALRTEPGRRTWHALQLRIPLMGALYRKLHLTRGLRMVGTMCGAGVALMDCVATAEDLCANTYFKELWRSIGEQIQVGRQLSEPMFVSPLVPRQVAQMISSGEKSGKLSFVMEQIAGFAEVELKEQIASLTRYIEPAMIIGMGLIIGGIAMAMLLPVFTIGKVMAS
jgi:type IV pilus assembly protein PilC